MTTRQVHITLIVLGSLFLVYSGMIYSGQFSGETSDRQSAHIAEGRLVWQKYNCQSCHQLYGLGGYLGPDLTNFCSDSTIASAVLESVLREGSRQMPAFRLSESERKQLFHFLQAAHASGNADPRSFQTGPDGMIQQ